MTKDQAKTPDPDGLCRLRQIAEEAARAGGRVAREMFNRAFNVRLKSDHSEVSEADEAAQAAVVSTIQSHRGNDAFITEEDLTLQPPPPAAANDTLCWVIDPIDGTRNFVRRVPLYACSVAVMRDGVPLAGAVYDPQRDRLYSSSAAESLFVDGETYDALGVVAQRRGGLNPRPVVGLPSNPVGPPAQLAHAWLDRFICRNLGTTALHLALVATGELDGMLADNPRLWDLAAGWLLITRTGGTVTMADGSSLFPIDVSRYDGEKLPTLAARGDVYSDLLHP